MSSAVESLLSPLPADLERFLRVVARPFLESGSWGVFDHVAAAFEPHDVDAAQLVDRFPGWSFGLGGYRAVRLPRGGSGLSLNGDDMVELSVAGLHHCRPEAEPVLDAFVATLRYLAGVWATIPASPYAARSPVVSTSQIRAELIRADLCDPSEEGLRELQLTRLLDREPLPGIQFLGPGQPDPEWQLSRWIWSFRNATDVESYLEQLALHILPPVEPEAPEHASSLSLVEHADYLDAVWLAAFQAHLVQPPGLAKSAELALDCRTSDEYASRLSALAELFDGLSTAPPGPAPPGERSLARLERFLAGTLDDAAARRAADAVATLRRLHRLRVGRQHRGAVDELPALYRDLGLRYPPASWADLWDAVRSVATGALEAIRDEVRALVP